MDGGPQATQLKIENSEHDALTLCNRITHAVGSEETKDRSTNVKISNDVNEILNLVHISNIRN